MAAHHLGRFALILYLSGFQSAACTDNATYNNNSSSSEGEEGPRVVSLGFVVYNVEEIDDSETHIAIHLGMSLKWTHPDIVKITKDEDELPPEGRSLSSEEFEQIWKPQRYWYNLKEMDQNQDEKDGSIVVRDNGTALWFKEFQLVISCPMEFRHYPLDRHKCPIMFGSTTQPIQQIMYETDHGQNMIESDKYDHKRLPFLVTFEALPESLRTWKGTAGIGNMYSRAGFVLVAERRPESLLVSWYLPSGLLVAVSWISFVIPIDLVPGRMALLVTVFLMEINLSSHHYANVPLAQGLTAADLWILPCILFVSAALTEFAVLLKTCLPKRDGGNRISKSADRDRDETKKRQKGLELAARVDAWSLILFPVAFSAFFVVYWSILLPREE